MRALLITFEQSYEPFQVKVKRGVIQKSTGLVTEEPLVSIIMPAFNAARFIEQSIASVIAQSYSNWELLVTDDGSTDGTAEIIQKLEDSRIRLFRQPNQGVSSARNTALKQMKGDFFTFLDADDVLPEESLEIRVVQMRAQPHVDLLAGGVSFFSETPEIPHKVWTPQFSGDPLVRLVRLDEKVFCNPSYIIRRKNRVNYRFDERLTHGEDLLFLISIATKGTLYFESTSTIIYCYRVGTDSAMSNLEGLEKGYSQILAAVSDICDGRITWKDRLYLRLRVGRIMFLSYLRAGDFLSALRVLLLTLSPLR